MSISFKKQDGDLVRTPLGRLQRIQGEEKLAQNVADQLLTDYDPVRGVGCELRQQAAGMTNPGVMPIFGESFLARSIEDSIERLSILQANSPRTTDTERVDPNGTDLRIIMPNKKEFMFYLTVKPVKGSPKTIPPYRVRLRQQYPAQAARSIFPRDVVTDDMIP